MQIEIKKHEHFIMALTYEEGEAGQVKDGALYYVPRDVFDNHDTFEELAENNEALDRIGFMNIKGDIFSQLQERMLQEEKNLLSMFDTYGHEKIERAVNEARKQASGGVHSGSCY